MSDVARAAGVHPSTVSLALRQHPSIPESTRQRIGAIAGSLGYRPNPMVSALMRVRRSREGGDDGNVIAFLTAFVKRNEWREIPKYVRLFEEASSYAHEHGYRLEEFWLYEKGVTPARLRSILLSRGIRGVMICPLPSGGQAIDFDFGDFAAIAFGLTLHQPALDQVTIDYYGVMELAINKLREAGRRRLGFVTARLHDERINHQFLSAYIGERYFAPRRFVSPLRLNEVTAGGVISWIKRYRPDAIIVDTEPHWKIVVRALKQAGMEESGRVVCLDCDPGSGDPGVEQDVRGWARSAVDWLTARMERAQFGIPASRQTVSFTGRWSA